MGRLGQFFLSLLGFVLVIIFAGSAHAQNTDTLILEYGRKFTVIDQITDPAERDALLKIYRARTPRAKVDMAEAFLGKYPQSWLLPEVYEIAAKAYIDLGELDRALQDGRASLQILPESPLLLVPLANAEVKLGRTAEAEQSAQEALDYLERFDGPSTVPKKQWPELQQGLKASCYFVLGRVRTSQGVNLQAGEERSRKLLESISLLARARSLNPDDPEIEYLIGLDYLVLGSRNEAAKWMSVVYQSESPPEDLALAKLRTIFGLSRGNPRQTFAGGAYVPTVFVGMYATLGMSTPSQHFVHAQDRIVTPEMEPPTRPRPVARVLAQASFHGIVVHVIQFLISLLRAPDVHVVELPLPHPKGRMMVDGGGQGDPREHLLAPRIAQVFPQVFQDKQSGAIFKLLHDLRGVRLRRRPDERVEMFRHENVSQDSEFQFPPQLAESRNPLLPKALGVKQARAVPLCGMLLVK